MPSVTTAPAPMRSTFKRLDVGVTFTSRQNGTTGGRFRKVSKTRADALDERGRGNTAAPVEFSRSHAVEV